MEVECLGIRGAAAVAEGYGGQGRTLRPFDFAQSRQAQGRQESSVGLVGGFRGPFFPQAGAHKWCLSKKSFQLYPVGLEGVMGKGGARWKNYSNFYLLFRRKQGHTVCGFPICDPPSPQASEDRFSDLRFTSPCRGDGVKAVRRLRRLRRLIKQATEGTESTEKR